MEKRYITTVLYTILVIALSVTGVTLIISLIQGHSRTAVVTSVAFVVSAAMMWLTQRGHLTLPRNLLPLSAFAATTFLAWGDKGLHDEALFGYTLALALAGLLLGKGGVIIYAFLGLAALAGLTWAEVNGLLVTPYASDTSYGSAVYSGVLFGFTAALLYIVIDSLTASRERARQNARELAESNSDLEKMRASLEEQVAKRTASAETARIQAETTWQAVEAQAWQTAGLVQLGDTMRGGQDPLTLANGVIGHLCHYLGARVGTLFVMQDNALYLAGTYACAPQTARFEPGQGLVGQAAREKQPIVVREVPAGYLTIVSGLGDTFPRQVVVWPLVHEGTVLGVAELGLLDELTSAQEQFLERASERVALALHTAQSRARIDELLAETQAQAEELAQREKELEARTK